MPLLTDLDHAAGTPASRPRPVRYGRARPASRTSARSAYAWLRPVAIALCIPGAIVMLGTGLMGLIIAFVYSIVYALVPRGRMPMPFWWGGRDVRDDVWATFDLRRPSAPPPSVPSRGPLAA